MRRLSLSIAMLRENLKNYFGGQLELARKSLPASTIALHHLLKDNVNLEERLRYCFSLIGGGLRIARESPFKGNLTILSWVDLSA
jgi:hypothetical protein